MNKTLFRMLDEIYTQIDKPFYDDLTDYEKGVKDILNMLDVRMTCNDEDEIYEYIIKTIRNNHDFTYDYYYQIDYIDKNGLANYIKSFSEDDKENAIKTVNILNQANMCINGTTTKYVLDMYRFKRDGDGMSIDDTDELFKKDIDMEA